MTPNRKKANHPQTFRIAIYVNVEDGSKLVEKFIISKYQHNLK